MGPLERGSQTQPLAVSIDLSVVNRASYHSAGGLNETFEWPLVSFIDFCLKLSLGGYSSASVNAGVIRMLSANDLTFGLSILPVIGNELREIQPNFQW